MTKNKQELNHKTGQKENNCRNCRNFYIVRNINIVWKKKVGYHCTVAINWGHILTVLLPGLGFSTHGTYGQSTSSGKRRLLGMIGEKCEENMMAILFIISISFKFSSPQVVCIDMRLEMILS